MHMGRPIPEGSHHDSIDNMANKFRNIFAKVIHKGTQKPEELHKVYLDSRADFINVGRAMGLWSGWRLAKSALEPPTTRPSGFSINTSELIKVEQRLDPPCPELSAYVADLVARSSVHVEDIPLEDVQPEVPVTIAI